MKNSNIEWTDHTFNPWLGCTKVSPGCDHCYAEARMDKRLHKVQWGPGNPRQRTSEKYWKEPKEWNKQRFKQCAVCGWRGAAAAPVIGCGKCGSIELDWAAFCRFDTRARVFCASLADVFDNEVPGLWRQHLMSLVADTPNLDWLFLTKRIGNARQMLSDASMHDGRLLTANDEYRPPANLWIGATIVDQAEADRDIPKLLAVPAAKRFLSMEPLLGPVDVRAYMWPVHARWPMAFNSPTEAIAAGAKVTYHRQALVGAWCTFVDWVIVGGESGPGARPMHPEWVADLRNQCAAAGTPFMFKQWGQWMPEAAMSHTMRMQDDGRWYTVMVRLDGSTHTTGPDDHTPYNASDIRMVSVGKKAAGRMLDGRTWDEGPA